MSRILHVTFRAADGNARIVGVTDDIAKVFLDSWPCEEGLLSDETAAEFTGTEGRLFIFTYRGLPTATYLACITAGYKNAVVAAFMQASALHAHLVTALGVDEHVAVDLLHALLSASMAAWPETEETAEEVGADMKLFRTELFDVVRASFTPPPASAPGYSGGSDGGEVIH